MYIYIYVHILYLLLDITKQFIVDLLYERVYLYTYILYILYI